MIQYRPIPKAKEKTHLEKGSGLHVSRSRLNLDAGQSPVLIMRSGDGSQCAMVHILENGAEFGKQAAQFAKEAAEKFASKGGAIESAVVGGSDNAKWKAKKLIQVCKGLFPEPKLFDIDGLYYRKIYFEPSTGVVEVHKEEANPDHWNPASASLTLEDGSRGFSDGHVGGVVANATRFFREKSTFTALREHIIPEHISLHPGQPFTLWSAACSSGVEAYSYAMYIHRIMSRIKANVSFKVIGTDINPKLIETAKAGEYEVSKHDLTDFKPYFERYGTLHGDTLKFGNEIKKFVTFKTFDLKQRPKKHTFHTIICANVFQYYQDEARLHFLENFMSVTQRPGYIFVGPTDRKLTNRLGLEHLVRYKMLRVGEGV